MNTGSFHITKTDRKLAVLIDPDKLKTDALNAFLNELEMLKPDCILLGGSLIIDSSISKTARYIRDRVNIPLVIFPGHFTHLTEECDGAFLLSLISGRNPDLLIGQHVLAAPMLKKLGDKLISTGYMLIDGGRPTSVSYMSNTTPIPADKTDIAVSTAIAGEFIGMRYIYLDAGSGARFPVNSDMVKAVSNAVSIPVIVGGGLRTFGDIEKAWKAGANMIVIGNGLEQTSETRQELMDYLIAQRASVDISFEIKNEIP